jgi:hypothetical protein
MAVLYRYERTKQEGEMKLNVKALALTAGIVWALAVLLVGAANLLWSGYGGAFLQLMASVYPGYHATGSVDGAVCGLVFGWLYNVFTGKAVSA